MNIYLIERPHVVIQGEGPNVNRKMLVLRFAACDLKCTNCDSAYTWNNLKGNIKYSVEDLALEIENTMFKNSLEYIMITGGEPLLQSKGIEALLHQFYGSGYKYEIETAGHHYWGETFKYFLNYIHINFSPKIGSLQKGDPSYIKWNGITNLRSLQRAEEYRGTYAIKIVIDPEDKTILDKIKNFMSEYDIKKEDIWLMPMGTTREEIIKNSQAVIDLAILEDFHFTSRQHILIYGDQKYV